MFERYHFMRYYLPGSLFLLYMMILSVPTLTEDTVRSLTEQPITIVGAFTGAFVISPTIGFLIYGCFNQLYEHFFTMKRSWRPALRYLEKTEFGKSEESKKHLGTFLKCNIQKKEFLDLVYTSSLEENEIKIDARIFETLGNQFSAFAARLVCGIFVPASCLVGWVLLWLIRISFNIDYSFEGLRAISIVSMAIAIVAISFVLLWDCTRPLFEAYQLEEYLIRTKAKEIKKLAETLFC